MQLYIVDGTYELFRSHFGYPSRISPDGIEVGMKFQAEVNGMPMPFEIISINPEEGDSGTVTCDFNHPMAGKELTFEVEIVDIREADEEEISHGHVHGDDGYQH